MTITSPAPGTGYRYRVGQLVEVRSADEIMATLDEHAEFGSMPFMPEMLRYCGQRLRIGKVAGKTCDTLTRSGMRRMDDAVHLAGVRCDGSGHGGCQAACLVYWKTVWLRPVDDGSDGPDADTGGDSLPPGGQRLLPLLASAAMPSTDTDSDADGRPDSGTDGARRYVCQATEMLRAAPHQLPLRHLGQYLEDLRSGNAGPLAVARALLVGLFNRYQGVSVRVLPRWLWIRGGLRWGFLTGVPGATPTARTDLQPGELVRIRPKSEIVKTLDGNLCNRGLGFDPEMARFCGRTARVARRVERILDERTGRMLHLKSPCIVLEGLVCEGAYNANCPRAIPPYWREIWLERIRPQP